MYARVRTQAILRSKSDYYWKGIDASGARIIKLSREEYLGIQRNQVGNRDRISYCLIPLFGLDNTFLNFLCQIVKPRHNDRFPARCTNFNLLKTI